MAFADPQPFLAVNMLRDQIALVYALGYRKTAMMVGHDQGSLMAGLGALIRPDMFPRLTLIGGGFGGTPSFPFNTANGAPMPRPDYTEAELDAEYAKLNPPRRYYQTAKEAAEQYAQIPEYYVMRRGMSMPATIAAAMPDAAYIKNCKWLTEAECEVYGQEYTSSGWTGALWNYRVRRRAFRPGIAEQQTFAGRTIDVPAQVIAAREDWGANRTIGGPMNIGKTGFTQFKGVHMVERAGHWAHEEQPEKVSELLTAFLREGG